MSEKIEPGCQQLPSGTWKTRTLIHSASEMPVHKNGIPYREGQAHRQLWKDVMERDRKCKMEAVYVNC